ncbi:MAG TPA: hypothetical protein VH142_04320 [Polyangiaceae bacterium]|jgi:hypothetical protein|nr:hypothetical protein [Polyangiaceae bacterium]
MKTSNLVIPLSWLVTFGLLPACSSSSDKTATDASSSGTHPTGPGTAQLPAMGATEITAWLKGGDYLNWTCEPTVHAARSPSPHGFNRICSNALLSQNATATGAWPEGVAAVKELHASADAAVDSDPVGYAVYVKTKADSAGGANWYWYETVPLDSAAPHDATGLVADGLGDGGPAKDICVSCHGAAGSDAPHTPSVGGRDQVYTPVH